MSHAGAEMRIVFSPGRVQLVQEEELVQGVKVLVTGATGLLGRAVCKEFQNNGWNVIGTGYRRAQPRFLRCDMTDEDAVKRLLHEHKPDVIVHCAAERRPDVMERHTEAAVHLNVHATGTLAKEAAVCGAFFIYISTDYVFDGRSPPYGEDDCPNPVNLYGRSKLEGERESLRHCPGAVILRVPVLFGEVESVAESAVTALWLKVEEAAEDHCSALDHCLQRFPTDARDVATVCRKLAERGRQDPSIRGIFHFSGKEQMTKYEMAVAMAQAFNLPSNHLVPLTEQPAAAAARPINSQLNCSRLELLNLSVEPQPFSTAIADCLWPFTADKRWRQTVFH
ncbi:methionine adenosyltransferase 2 subunit beta isoform X1 [Oryzias melastigma]|uniref:methionine adenosyltransferase 2 subunit beta isoform X1 n=1 Tax=Oryzias melastigma TaxID=30732 RepID=UPI000CF80E53|nr:methionine adenosyltransferase 2 subunit beta isoform X1 [Oryzias melastigma]